MPVGDPVSNAMQGQDDSVNESKIPSLGMGVAKMARAGKGFRSRFCNCGEAGVWDGRYKQQKEGQEPGRATLDRDLSNLI